MGLPPLADRTLTGAFRRTLDQYPDKVAHIEGDRSWTFTQAWDRSSRRAAGLRGLCREGRPVALMLDNHVDFVHTWLGVALAGLVQVPVNTAYVGSFLAHLLSDSTSEIVVTERAYLPSLIPLLPELPALHTIVVRGPAAEPTSIPGVEVVGLETLDASSPWEPQPLQPADLMAYMYTSGTTGVSKGVEVSHAHAYTYASREDQSRPVADDRVLVTLPMFHLAGQWYGVYQALIAGASCVIEPRFSVSKFWDTVRSHQITETVLLGAMAEMLQQATPRPDDADNPLTLAVMAPLASDPIGFGRRFGIAVEAVYGMSEIGAVLGSYGTDLVPGEAGVCRAGEYELRLVDEDGNDVPDGSVGELLVRPTHPESVMRAYHGLPEKTAETVRDGWVHTGDAFRRVEGHYFFADRMKDALRRRGENISSFEVERVVNEFPAVLESAVVGVPSPVTEDEIKVVVVPREGYDVDPRELVDFLIGRLPYFMVPRYVEVAADLPRTPTQKIQKHLLRDAGTEHAWDRDEAGVTVPRPGRD